MPGRTGRAPGCLGHGVGAGVDADGERRRVLGRGGQGESSVAGAQVDHDPGRAGATSGDLADVHLVDALAGDDAHARTVRDDRVTRNARRRTAVGLTYTHGRCPTSRSAPTRSCRRRSTRGTRRPRTWRGMSSGSSSPHGPERPAQHVGSSSVPGMPGKNVVDLGVEADPDDIGDIVDSLLSLGFQRQGGLAPFPPTRPLMLGNVDHDGVLVPHPPPRHAAGPPRAGRADRVPGRAPCRPRAARRLCGVEAGVRRGGARRRRQPAVHGPQGRLRPGLALPPRHPPATRRRAGAAGARRDHRGPRRRPARPDARDRGPGDGLPPDRPRPGPGLPDGRGRGRDRRRGVRRR